jgi:hypothetical protein
MLTLVGRKFQCCDRLTRRDLIRVGTLGLGGLTLPTLLRARASAARSSSETPNHKTSVIFVELAGGPTHIETYDPKPAAPAEYRGPLDTIATNVAGVHFSQLMAQQAQIMDKLAILRAVTHTSSSHGTSAHLTQTGYYLRDPRKRENDMPCAGAVTAQVRGANAAGIPSYVAIPQAMRFGRPAYLGKRFSPFETGGDPASSKFEVNNLNLNAALSLERLTDRRALLTALDCQRRIADSEGVASSVDHFSREAYELVTGGRARLAFNIEAENARTRDRYGRHTTGQSLLLARRLVESGVTFVTVRVGGWDDHVQIEQRMKEKGPAYDQGFAALVSDLHERGLDRDVLVVAMGEFGRTPRINANAGRDHWGTVMSVVLAGGGLKVGQVIGSSSSKGETPQDLPYRPENILAVVYRHLGIDPRMTFPDFSGRPRYILENRLLVSEVV